MPEDQGVNGDLWNNEASKLMKLFNWKQIGDSDLDVYNENNKPQGLDRMFLYSDVTRKKRNLGFFLEAKRYKTSSFNIGLLQGWIKTLDDKILKNRYSEKFISTYPSFQNATINNGVIVIWFSDTEEYAHVKFKMRQDLGNLKLPARIKDNTLNKIYVLENDEILRLSSLYDSILKFEQNNKVKIKFYYPSSTNFQNPIDVSDVLSIEYMFSKIVLAEAYKKNNSNPSHRIVFYFGSLTLNSFKRLKSFLIEKGFFDKRKEMIIYIYQRDDEFRKIFPDVKDLFSELALKISTMEIFSQLPTFIKNYNE